MSSPNTIELQQARQLWIEEKFQKSVAAFEKVYSKEPRNIYAMLDLARVYGQLFQQDKMEPLISKIEATFPASGELYLQLGLTYRMAMRQDKAVAYLKKAVKTLKDKTIALLELSNIYERQGSLAEAEKAVTRCLKYTPGLPEALAIRSKIKIRSNKLEDAKKILKSISELSEDEVDLNTLSVAQADYAKLIDKEGDRSGAMEVLKQSKSLLEKQAEVFRKELGKHKISDFFSKLKKSDLEEWRERAPENDRKVCLMASFPRSGTTLLENILGSHPCVLASDEMDIFNKLLLTEMLESCGESVADITPENLGKVDDQLLEKLRTKYFDSQENVLNQKMGNRILLDKNPNYTVFIPFHLRLFPDLKVLIPLRDPRDVILSCYFQYFPMNPFSCKLLSIESTAKRYVHDMSQWISLRSQLEDSQYHEVIYENLTTDPEAETRKMLDFLCLPWDEQTLDYHKQKKSTVINAPTYADASQKIYQSAKNRWMNYEEYFTPLRPILEPVMNELGYQW